MIVVKKKEKYIVYNVITRNHKM